MPAIIEDQGTAKKARFARLFWPIFRGIVAMVAAWSFVAFLSVDLYGGKLGFTAFVVFLIAMLAVRVMPFAPVTPLRAVEGQGTLKATQYRFPEWSLLAFGVIFGVGCNWECVFLWFSRRYDPLSVQVVGTTALIMVLYTAVSIVVACLTTKNWRTVVVAFAFGPGALAGIVLRLRLLR